ncbi:MAG: hypothetical protein ACHQQQ_09665 [Bacteroidota bacterium]
MSILDTLPSTFYPDDQVKERVKCWSKSNSLPSFELLIPSFFEKLVNLDSPLDSSLVRDILYKDGALLISYDRMLAEDAADLPNDFVSDVYKEQGEIKNIVEFNQKLSSIAAEIRCAKLIQEVGAYNIRKCTQGEDISCEFARTRYGIQVKLKTNEDFSKDLFEQALVGEMYKQKNEVLRNYLHVSLGKFVGVHKDFLNDVLSYIHSSLERDLELERTSYKTENVNVKLFKQSEKFYVDISGEGKYKDSFLGISFNHDLDGTLSIVGNGFYYQKPDEKLWGLLGKIIEKIKPNLIGWIDLNMTYKYVNYLSYRTEINSFLKKYDIPLVLLLEVDFSKPRPILNGAAMAMPLFRELASRA